MVGRRARPSAGFTLVELLIVIVIMLLITAAAIGTAIPALRDRRVREASRTLQAVLIGARDRALASGQVRGVRLIRSVADPWEVDTLMYVGAPDPYGVGLVDVNPNTREVRPVGGGGIDPHWEHIDPGADQTPGTVDDVIRVVDGQAFIRFNFTGPFYRVLQVNRGASPATLLLDPSEPVPPELLAVPYQIFNPPQPLAETPTRLPADTVIDVRTEVPVSHPLSGNPQVDVPRSRNIPNQLPPPAYITNNIPPIRWPAMDILFGPNGAVVGPAAAVPYIHFWVGERGDKGNAGPDGVYGVSGSGVPDDVGPRGAFRLVTLNTRTGDVIVNELAAFTGSRPGFPQIYQRIEDRLDKTIAGTTP